MLPLLVGLASYPAQVTDPITRDGAQDAARRELSERVYQQARPDPVRRAIDWLWEEILELLERAGRVVPGGVPSLVAVVVVVVLLLVALRLGLGPAGVRDAITDRRRGARSRTAADYRAEAETLAAAGRFKEAVRGRLRALIRELEERGVLEARAGRTVDELADEAGAVVPAVTADVHEATRIFDEIWYGDRPATASAYDRVRAIDERVRDARLVTV